MANDPLLVHHKRHTLGDAEETQHTVKLGDFSLGVAQKWKAQAELFSKALVGGFTVNADAEDLRLRFFEQGETSLVRLELLGSGRGVGQNVERQNDVLRAAKVAQPDKVAAVIGQFEIGRRVAGLGRCHESLGLVQEGFAEPLE